MSRQGYAVVPVADGVRLPFRRCYATTGATSCLTVAAPRVGSQSMCVSRRTVKTLAMWRGFVTVTWSGVAFLQHASLFPRGWEIYTMVCNGGYSCIGSCHRAPYAGFLGACWWSALCKFTWGIPVP